MSEWCFQCGIAQKPERAVGWDEDGEPACALHRVKAQRPFSLPAPIELPPVIAEPIVVKVKPAAAPSPVQTSAKEKSMANTKGAREPRPCPVEGCGREIAACYMNQHLRAAHGTEAAGATAPKKAHKVARQIEGLNADRIDRLTDHVNREIGVAQEVPLHLTESQIGRLLNLLLPSF